MAACGSDSSSAKVQSTAAVTQRNAAALESTPINCPTQVSYTYSTPPRNATFDIVLSGNIEGDVLNVTDVSSSWSPQTMQKAINPQGTVQLIFSFSGGNAESGPRQGGGIIVEYEITNPGWSACTGYRVSDYVGLQPVPPTTSRTS